MTATNAQRIASNNAEPQRSLEQHVMSRAMPAVDNELGARTLRPDDSPPGRQVETPPALGAEGASVQLRDLQVRGCRKHRPSLRPAR
jgi:hypothetical protein